jgi:RimJ/RimL family protein N-acetyltransferase
MNDHTLKLIGRSHTVKEVEEAFKLAREMGFANINMDVILGLPEETATELDITIKGIEALRPDSLTIHSLSIKRASALTEWVNENGLQSLQNTEETMKIAAAGAAGMGMFPYYLYRQKNTRGNFENVGYATPGHYGLYNILTMEDVHTVVALGAGSVTKRVFADGRIERCDNVKEIEQYIGRIEEMIERTRSLLNESEEALPVSLRAWELSDAPALAKVINNKKVQDNLRDGLPFPYHEEDALAFIKMALETGDGAQYIRAILFDGEVVGCIGVYRKDNIYRMSGEMGYYLGEPYWGRGIMTEAVRQMCGFILENTDIIRIFADPFAFNDASCRVLEKAGFHFEGLLRKNAVKNGEVVDMKLYARVK